MMQQIGTLAVVWIEHKKRKVWWGPGVGGWGPKRVVAVVVVVGSMGMEMDTA